MLSRLFRRRFLEELDRVHRAGKLQFFGEHAALADAKALRARLAPLRRCEWVVYAKRPFAGPQAVLAYLSLANGNRKASLTLVRARWGNRAKRQSKPRTSPFASITAGRASSAPNAAQR